MKITVEKIVGDVKVVLSVEDNLGQPIYPAEVTEYAKALLDAGKQDLDAGKQDVEGTPF